MIFIMMYVLLELLCGHYRTSHYGGENLTFISQFQRFDMDSLFCILPFSLYSDAVILYSIYTLRYFLFLFQDNPSDKDLNQGTLVIFNLDPSVSNEDLRQIFGAYGEVKEVNNFFFFLTFFFLLVFLNDLCLTFCLNAFAAQKQIRETPHKRHHKFIEFYDVRAAEAALKALNRCDIAGKRIKLEPSRPGGARRKYAHQFS